VNENNMSTTPRTNAQFIPHPDEPAPTMQIHDEVIALRRDNAELRAGGKRWQNEHLRLLAENIELRIRLDASCNAEELRQVRAENTEMRKDRKRCLNEHFRLLDENAELRQVRAELAELRKDKARLDWLDHNAIPWRWMSPEKIDQLGPLVITWKGNRSLRLELDNQMTDATK
jgi:hypothetical protein